jgi:signal transduction histidine kinase/CheY-like chemotaxis protein
MKIAKKYVLYLAGLLIFLLLLISLLFIYGEEMMGVRQQRERTRKNLPAVYQKKLENFYYREKMIVVTVFFSITAAGFLYMIYLMLHFSRNLVKPLASAVQFSNTLAGGQFPPPLPVPPRRDFEIDQLIKALNYLRDRLYRYTHKLKKSQEREKKARESAETVNTMKAQFLARLSPELRTPLNSIIGYAEIIQNDIKNGLYDKSLDRKINGIMRNAISLNLQITDVFKISEMDSRKGAVNSGEFNTADFMRELTAHNAFLQHEENIAIQNNCSRDMPEYLKTDKNILAGILSILINAISKVSGDGEVISCGCARSSNKIIFWVRDSGKSAPGDRLADLFNRYHNEDSKKRMELANSVLLNLIFAERKALELGAVFVAESSSKAVSEFRVEFRKWDITPDSSSNSAMNNSVETESNIDDLTRTASNVMLEDDFFIDLTKEPETYKALIADNDRDNATILESILKNDGYEVICMKDGADPMDNLLERNFNLLILSNALPQINTFDLIYSIRADKKLRKLPVILIAGYLSDKDRQRLMLSGVDRCFTKPLDFSLVRKSALRLCRDYAANTAIP